MDQIFKKTIVRILNFQLLYFLKNWYPYQELYLVFNHLVRLDSVILFCLRKKFIYIQEEHLCFKLGSVFSSLLNLMSSLIMLKDEYNRKRLTNNCSNAYG